MGDTKKGSRLTVALAGALILGFSLAGLLLPDREFSAAERRRLADAPKLSAEAVRSGAFMTEAETYLQEQFTFREGFRRLKTFVFCRIFGQKVIGGIFLYKGHASKMDYPLDTASIDYSASRFQSIYDTYLKDSGSRVYVSVVPDKNRYMAEEAGVPHLDPEELEERLLSQMPYASYIDIGAGLGLEDYYKTDIHWRQERLAGTAELLAESMGTRLPGDWRTVTLSDPFYGVYRGQSAMPLPAETISYLEADYLEACTVYDYETGSYVPVYDPEAVKGPDPYGMFLAGSKSLLRIENPAAPEGKRLILFRDSFGSSIAPLLAGGYREVVLVDIRYISPALLGQFLSFEDRDVLFLYSESVLNNSETLK